MLQIIQFFLEVRGPTIKKTSKFCDHLNRVRWRILSPFTGRKKRKAWNKNKEKRQNLAEAGKGSYYNQEEWLEEFLDDKGAFYNSTEAGTGGVL